MIIADINIQKMDHADTRYPDPIVRFSGKSMPLADVYLMTFTADGKPMECPFYVRDDMAMTPLLAASMLKQFADAISKYSAAHEKAA